MGQIRSVAVLLDVNTQTGVKPLLWRSCTGVVPERCWTGAGPDTYLMKSRVKCLPSASTLMCDF